MVEQRGLSEREKSRVRNRTLKPGRDGQRAREGEREEKPQREGGSRERERKSGCLATSHLVRSQPTDQPPSGRRSSGRRRPPLPSFPFLVGLSSAWPRLCFPRSLLWASPDPFCTPTACTVYGHHGFRLVRRKCSFKAFVYRSSNVRVCSTVRDLVARTVFRFTTGMSGS